ncbi:MAG: hypothetical protein ACFFAS_10290 [Promethearchaeota archaeon]
MIILGPSLLDPNSMKNLLIDTLFGPELGNVQRYLILMHMENILAIADEFDKTMAEVDAGDENISLSDEIEIVERLEQNLNRNILEYNKDIVISKITRLLFTSTFKTSMFNEMIDKLDGFHFSIQIEAVISRIRKTLNRERNSLRMKASKVENQFLAILNFLAIFELGLGVIEILQDPDPDSIILGIARIAITTVLVLACYILYKNREKKL